jgi:hypothetical protein
MKAYAENNIDIPSLYPFWLILFDENFSASKYYNSFTLAISNSSSNLFLPSTAQSPALAWLSKL